MAVHGLKMSGFFVGAQGISEPPSGYGRPWVKDVGASFWVPQGISEPPSGYGRPWVKDVGASFWVPQGISEPPSGYGRPWVKDVWLPAPTGWLRWVISPFLKDFS